MTESFVLDTPIGYLQLLGDALGLSKLTFIDHVPVAQGAVPEVLKDAVFQLHSYFNKDLHEFHLKLNPSGTEFEKKVWEMLLRIPYG